MRLRARPLSVAVLGGGCLAAALLLWAPGAFNLRDDIREVMFDRALPLLASPPETSPVVVVDIDRESLARYGAWPWRRQVLADLVRKIAEAKPRVIGLDMLLSEPDRFSPIGLVRNLGTEADRSGIADLARKLPDGDAALADALKAAPVVLGFVLEPGAGEVPPGAPILARRRLQVPDIWQAPAQRTVSAPLCSPTMWTDTSAACRFLSWSGTGRVPALPPRSCASAMMPPPSSLILCPSGCISGR